LPAAGGAMGENAVTPTYNSTFTLQALTMKIMRRKGAVTNFLQDASQNFIDAAAVEFENQLRLHMYSLNYYNLYGNATANAYEPSGLDTFITTNRFNGFSSGAPTVPTDLTFLNKMIAASDRQGGIRHERVFYMSPEMLMKVSSLLTNVRLQQGMAGLGDIEVAGGWKLHSYLGIPIVASTFLSGAGASTMGTVTAASGGTTGGSLSDGTYYFRVAALTLKGEQMASAEASVTLSGGGSTQKITLSFTAVADAQAYKVYAGATTGLTNTTLKRVVPSIAYDGSGTPGAAVTSISITSMTAGTEVPTANQSDIALTAVGGINSEIVVLHDVDPIQGLGKYPYTHSGGNRMDGVVSITPLAITDDFLPFMVKTYAALCPSFEATSVISRGWRVQ